MAPLVVVLGHSTDADIERIVLSLEEAGIATKVWLFDAQDRELEVDAGTGSFLLRRWGRCLSTDDLLRASLVIHRVGNGRWNLPVTASRGTSGERRFAEREWASLLSSLLLEAEQRYAGALWINRPSSSILAGRKQQLLATADLDGLQVARYRISTENLLPVSESGQWICKAINEDEEVDEERTFASVRLPDELVKASPFRTACPSLIQERVLADHELRVYYLLDRALGLRLTAPGRDYADIRLLPREASRCGRSTWRRNWWRGSAATAAATASPTASSTSWSRRTAAAHLSTSHRAAPGPSTRRRESGSSPDGTRA